jgi:flavin reductase (DIM6/NTAB) family NADH-FMN oxidoreductase RutF
LKKEQPVKYLSYPQAIFVVGTYDQEGKPNIATVALAGMCSHEPPCFGISLRPQTYSHQNVLARRAFTVNVPSRTHIVYVDYAGLVSGRQCDKFEVCGLTAVRSQKVDAPYVDEFRTVAECSLRQAVELGSHTMFIGEIKGILGDEAVLTHLPKFGPDMKDIPDMQKVEGIVYAVVGQSRSYVCLGQTLGEAYSVGRELLK